MLIGRTLRTLPVLLALASPVVAQSRQQTYPTPAGPAGAQEPSFLISVNFAGGTVAQYIEALKKAAPDKAVNIVASERAAKQGLTTISLKDVPLGVAAYAIQSASTSPTGDWGIGPMQGDPNAAGFATSSYRVDFSPSRRVSDAVIVEAYSLQRIIRGDAKEDQTAGKMALTAIETGLKLQNSDGDAPPELKFHQESGMLFVRGQSPDVHLVGQIISRMSDDAERRRAVVERAAKEEKLIGLAMREAAMDVQTREMELEAAQKLFSMTETQVTKGASSQTELMQRSMELQRARMNLERAKLNVERAQLQIPREGGRAGAGDEGPDSAQLLAIIDQLKVQNKQLADQLAALKKGSGTGDDGSRAK